MKRLFRVAVAFVAALTVAPSNAGGKKDLANAAIARLLRRDAARDAATVAVPTAESRTVWRYTSEAEAKRETRRGIAADRHFTPNVTPGRPPRPSTAQGQYGLPQSPQVRMTVRIEKGSPVLRNRALGGGPGRGEIVNTELLPPGAVQKVTRLPRE